MAKVLSRALALVHELARRRGAPASTGEIAAACRLPPATCARLLQELREAGFADQEARRGGWSLGPAPHALAAVCPYRDRLLACAEPHLAALRRASGAAVVLAVLRGHRRLTLRHLLPAGAEPREELAESDDVLATAGGRLLVALLPPRRRERVLQALDAPGAAWPGLLTRAELARELRAIRAARVAVKREGGVLAVAMPLGDGRGGAAALGCWRRLAEAPREAELLRHLHRAVAAIGRAVGPPAGSLSPAASGSAARRSGDGTGR